MMRFINTKRKQLAQFTALLISGVLLSLPENSQTVTGTGTLDSGTSNESRARQDKAYRPRSYNTTTAVSMVFAFHGYVMDLVDALNLWHFDLIADQHNTIVAV
ncbi:MAG: hypothetical protein K6L80_15465 [Agarilytica sp.]